jgi:hypothetical protein
MDMTSNWNPHRLYKRVEMLHKGVVGCSTRELKDEKETYFDHFL